MQSHDVRIPRREIVKFVIKEVLGARKAASQKELAGMVQEALSRGDKRYRISGERVRRIALDIPVSMRVETRQGPVPKRCPACGRGLSRAYSKNLAGKKVLSSLRCRRCGYAGSGGRWAPGRYYFSL